MALDGWAAASLRRIVLAQLASVSILMSAAASQTCSSADEVKAAHADQGDEVILSYDSWMRENSETIIYRDPSDGVVTAVAIYADGVACIVDVGQTLSDEDAENSATRDLGRHPI